MRQIGTVPEQTAAERFTAFLITQGISAQAEQDSAAWAIWVRDEDQVAAAKEAFLQFTQQPNDPRYERVVREAGRVLKQEAERREQARRNLVEVRVHWSRGGKRQIPLTKAILTLCVIVFVLEGLGQRNGAATRMLAFRDPVRLVTEQNEPLGEQGEPLGERLADIKAGQVWRVVTPIFLHGGIMHLVFNLLMFHVFASRIEERQGTVRLAWMILVIAVLSNTAQALAPSTWGTFSGGTGVIGNSGVVYGLFGYTWIKTIYEPELGLFVSGSTVALLIVWMFLGLFGFLDGNSLGLASDGEATVRIANLAHVAGLFTGLGVGYCPVAWRWLIAQRS